MNPEPSNGFAGRKHLPALFHLLAHPVLRYAIAVLLVGLACLLRFAFAHAFGSQNPYITFFPAVMLAALLCGLGPGLFATALSALYVAFWILPPFGQFAISGTPDAIALALFGCLGIFVSMIAGLYNQASAKVAAYEQEQARLAGRQPSVAPSAVFHLPEATLSFKKSLAFDAALALVLAILVSVGWLAYRDMTATAEADRWVNHTHLVIEEIDGLLSSLNTAETGERGFIITGDQKYLNPYNASLSEIEAHLASLRTLTADNPRQQQRLAGITPVVAAKLAELKDTIALRETKGLQAASNAVSTHLDRNIMASLRPLLDAARHEEEQLLQVRTAAREANTRDTIHSVFLGGSLGALALILLFASLKLELARRRRAETELRQHRDHLENLVAARTRDLQTEAETKTRALDALRHSEARSRLQAVALQSAANAITITDRNGVIIWVNDAFTQLTGYSATEAIGQNPRALKSGMHDPAFYKNMWRTILADHVWHGTLVNKRKDGTLYTEEMTITPVSEASGQITHFIAIKQDITDRQRAEEEIRSLNTDLAERVRLRTAALQVANHELEAFCYSVSHDLRAPLRGINGFSQALLDDYADKLDPTATDFLQRITVGCQRMAQLIDDLLNLSRLSRAEMRLIPVSLSKLAGELAAELKESTPDRVVAVTIANDVHAVGDPALLRAALSNLLANAWKFTSNGADAAVEFGSSHSNGHSTYFVRDNGAGFDMAYADKLFQPFQRLHGIREFPGNGIGLATVERIIRRHGGRVWAEAVPGQGATFYFTLDPEGQQHHG